jgi:hypothetical protein
MRLHFRSLAGYIFFCPKTDNYENIVINCSKKKRQKIVEIAQINWLNKYPLALRKCKCSILEYASGKTVVQSVPYNSDPYVTSCGSTAARPGSADSRILSP